MKSERTDRKADRPRMPGTLEMPRQAPPVDRTAAASVAAWDDTGGVEANDFFDTLKDILDL
ncbi:hypothetical protein ACIBK8_27030 [Streptomyces sp. NPDC050161]|uniref:hypothetical protein n=1 Tax=Streptomyces sp. NPDC050161 TaxID=3365604 RepID=UPI0037972DC3